MRNWSRLRSLSGREMLFLARCLTVVAVVRLALTFSSYNRVRNLVTRLDARRELGRPKAAARRAATIAAE